MKACPFCAEEIQDAAVKCKHCGESLAVRPTGLRAPIPPLQLLAAVVTLGGIGLAVWALQLDTSVATTAGRVHNLSLAAEKQNCLIAGGIATVIGVVLAGVSRPGLRAFVVAAILVAGGVSGLAKYAEYQAALRSDAAIRETEATGKNLKDVQRAEEQRAIETAAEQEVANRDRMAQNRAKKPEERQSKMFRDVNHP